MWRTPSQHRELDNQGGLHSLNILALIFEAAITALTLEARQHLQTRDSVKAANRSCIWILLSPPQSGGYCRKVRISKATMAWIRCPSEYSSQSFCYKDSGQTELGGYLTHIACNSGTSSRQYLRVREAYRGYNVARLINCLIRLKFSL